MFQRKGHSRTASLSGETPEEHSKAFTSGCTEQPLPVKIGTSGFMGFGVKVGRWHG